MTLLQLRRHMDRRFDRLERLKANRSDLSRFATKRDLRRFATKRDLRGFARQRDLRGFVRKRDLRGFARKRDLRGFATKKDLQALRVDLIRYMNIVAERITADFRAALDPIGPHSERLEHHDKVLDDHERRLTHLEQPTLGGPP